MGAFEGEGDQPARLGQRMTYREQKMRQIPIDSWDLNDYLLGELNKDITWKYSTMDIRWVRFDEEVWLVNI